MPDSENDSLTRLFRPEIQAMQPYVPGEQPQGGKFIKLNTNENPYPPSPKVAVAIQEAATVRLERYPDPLGTAFRIRAAEVLGVEPDWILCGNGSDDILTIVTRAFVGTGQRLRLPYPSYILYRTLAQLQGAEWEEVHFKSDFTLDSAFSKMHEQLKLVFLPNPNSPSGTVIALEEVVRDGAGRFSHGDSVTLGDLFIVPQLYGARRFDVDLAKFPTLLRVEAACASLEPFALAVPAAQPDAPPPAPRSP